MKSNSAKSLHNIAIIGAAFAIGISLIELASASTASTKIKGGEQVNSGAYSKAKEQLPPDIYSIYHIPAHRCCDEI